MYIPGRQEFVSILLITVSPAPRTMPSTEKCSINLPVEWRNLDFRTHYRDYLAEVSTTFSKCSFLVRVESYFLPSDAPQSWGQSAKLL
jgi:hypothetical protein